MGASHLAQLGALNSSEDIVFKTSHVNCDLYSWSEMGCCEFFGLVAKVIVNARIKLFV